LCDPPEAKEGGMGKSVQEVMNLTLVQCAAFLTDKKLFKSEGNTVSSFKEAKALMQSRKKDKDGKQTR
jgi:hypothetical protein